MKKIILLLCLIAALYLPGRAQFIINKADQQFELYNYQQALPYYQEAYKKKQTLHAAGRIALIYKLNNDYAQAEKWYAIAKDIPGASAEHTLNYAIALQNNAKFNLAATNFKAYAQLDNRVSEAQLKHWLASCDSAQYWMANPKKIQLENLKAINTKNSDWAAMPYQNQLVYVSDYQDSLSVNKARKAFLRFPRSYHINPRLYGWTGDGYVQIKTYDELLKEIKALPFFKSHHYHLGPITFNAQNTEAIFALTRIPKDKKRTVNGQIPTIHVELFASKKLDNGEWGDPVALNLNNAEAYSVGDPHLTADGQTLYFTSDRPGGKGGMDIYTSRRNGDGTWAQPVNLYEINTPLDERTPFLSDKAELYFSSNGHIGMGGLDVFRVVEQPGEKVQILNMGAPINSPQDDFAFNFQSDKGYLSSNRPGGVGSDDVYTLNIPKPEVKPKYYLEGYVYSLSTKEALAHAQVNIKSANKNIPIITDANAYFKVEIPVNEEYHLKASNPGYLSADTNLLVQKSMRQDFYLDQLNLNKVIKINDILYDFDKSNIRPDAAIELNKVVKVMLDNPTIEVELGSHTDSRGNDQYNQWLSQSRANSAVQYIIDQGVQKSRITAKGYGESRLLNECSNGAKCTEAAHQLNRRTEIRIVKF